MPMKKTSKWIKCATKTAQIKTCMNEKNHTNEKRPCEKGAKKRKLNKKRSKWEKNYTIDEK